jgi:hypothetical protein
MPMSPQEQEALSIRYQRHAIVAPLSGGGFAVFAHDYSKESMVIVDDPDNLALAITTRASMAALKSPSREGSPSKRKPDPVDLDFSDLGI